MISDLKLNTNVRTLPYQIKNQKYANKKVPPEKEGRYSHEKNYIDYLLLIIPSSLLCSSETPELKSDKIPINKQANYDKPYR